MVKPGQMLRLFCVLKLWTRTDGQSQLWQSFSDRFQPVQNENAIQRTQGTFFENDHYIDVNKKIRTSHF